METKQQKKQEQQTKQKDKYAKDLTEQIHCTKTYNEIKELQNSVKEIKNEMKELIFCIKQFIDMLSMPSYEEEEDDV